MMVPVGRLILARSFPKDQLIRAMSFMIIPGLVGPMLGPLIGGWITTYASWRWVFFVNAPLGLVSLAMIGLFLKPIAAEPPGPFDWPGFLLTGAGFAAVQLGLDSLSAPGGPSLRTAVLAAAAIAALALYARYAHARAGAILDLNLLRRRVFAIATLAGHLARMGLAAAPFLTPLLLQLGFGLSAFQSGLLTFGMAGGQIVMRFGVPALLRRFGVRLTLIASSLVAAAMTAGLVLLEPQTARVLIVAYFLALGVVQSILYSTIGALSFSGIDAALAGRATTITAISQRLSMGMGVAVSAFVLRLAGGGHGRAADFAPAFLVMALVLLSSVAGFLRLQPDDGRDLAPRG
jgi:hypothetical protein